MKKKIFKKIIFDINIFFLIVLISLGSIVWVIQAVNFLDFIVEDGHGFRVYFYYTLLNFPKILSAIFPFILFLSLFYTFNKYENNNELLIFWTNGITKENFAKTFVKFSLIYLIIQILLTTIVVPKSQNLARSFIRTSTIDFFPSLLKEKKFIDTVENLTIFIEKKNSKGEMFNILLKDKLDDGSSQIIYAKKGYLNILDDENFLILKEGKIINIENEEIVSLDFGETKFNLSKYTTKTTTWPKIQEHKTFTLFSCVVNILLKEKVLKENFYLKCTPQFYSEVVQELLKRIYLPIYIPVISLIACFLIIKSKESFNYSKIKILLFVIGILTIIISELSIKLASINQLAFIIFLFIPILIFILTFNIFKIKSKTI
tara:strand:+ start:60 stop:1181 length:1122 start_codon:yes stop_codon:yes gene_type:complete